MPQTRTDAPVDLVVKHARLLVTMDAGREIPGGYVAVRDGQIVGVGEPGKEPSAERTIDASGCIVTPGLINTHQHFLQNLTRNFHPEKCTEGRLAWILPLQKMFCRLDEEAAFLSAWVACAEHLLGGCTTASDHLNNHPFPKLIDAEIAAAQEVGIRIHATRGAMDIGEGQGGTTPAAIVQDRDTILADSERLIQTYHDRDPLASVQIALAPCNPFAASFDLMRDAAELAEKYDVRLHTHLAEGEPEEAFCRERFGCTPTERLEACGWLDPRTWVAHASHINDAEAAKLGKHHLGIAHCPSANLMSFRLIAPVKRLQAAGCAVGLACDGGASAGHCSLWMEARTAMQVGHLRVGDDRMTARDALELATVGSAACLGRSHSLGKLKAGYAADLVVWDTDNIRMSGVFYDPIEAFIRNGPFMAKHTIVGGKLAVENGQLAAPALEERLRAHGDLAFSWQDAFLGERRKLVFPPR